MLFFVSQSVEAACWPGFIWGLFAGLDGVYRRKYVSFGLCPCEVDSLTLASYRVPSISSTIKYTDGIRSALLQALSHVRYTA